MTETSAPADTTTTRELSRQLVLLLANVTVITALLVYFGWRRAESQAAALGIDESILGMSTRDYLLRSVGPVLQLLLAIGVAGLAAVAADRAVRARVAAGWQPRRWVPWLLAAIAIALPVLVYATRSVWDEVAFQLFPVTLAAGLGLLIYAYRLRFQPEPSPAMQLFAVLIFGVLLFWTASNRAEVLGNQLAADYIAGSATEKISVEVSSDKPVALLEDPSILRNHDGRSYRYAGLRLLDRIDKRVFVVPEGWQPGSGPVVVLTDDGSLTFGYGR
ncbi:hypothetical protein AB0H43_27070 [Hamadaea sp. NPDC050747]|uniref:hypothetical protein n=1 Tax=Hamadaea sp. NPDC050747 TaxID=3155789 RepID=UPI003403C0AF